MALRLIPAIHRATHQIALALQRMATLDVDQAEAHILAHLADHGDTAIADLHAAFAHRRSTLTSILDRLTARRLVTRETSAKDRRSLVVRLTPSGRALARRVSRRLNELERRALAGVPAGVRDALLDVLERFQLAATGGFGARRSRPPASAAPGAGSRSRSARHRPRPRRKAP